MQLPACQKFLPQLRGGFSSLMKGWVQMAWSPRAMNAEAFFVIYIPAIWLKRVKMHKTKRG